MKSIFQCCGKRFSNDQINDHLKAAHGVNADAQKFQIKQVGLMICLVYELTYEQVSLLMFSVKKEWAVDVEAEVEVKE